MANPQQPDLLSRTEAPAQPKPTKTKTAKATVIPPEKIKPAQAVAKPKAQATTTAVSTKVRAAPEAPEPKNLMQAMMQAVTNPAFDADKLKLIMEQLHKQQDREAEAQFNKAMLDCQMELPTIIKDSKGDKGIQYAKLEKIMARCMPIIQKHGFAPSWSTEDSPIPDHYRIVCLLSHSPSGFTRRYQWDLTNDSKGAKGEPNKTPVQGFGSSMSYGQRYGFRMMFNLILAGEDNDGAAQKAKAHFLNEKEIGDITALMKAKQISLDDTLKWINKVKAQEGKPTVEALSELPAADYKGIMNGLSKIPDPR